MTSRINRSVPPNRDPSLEDIRNNFIGTADDIEDLQSVNEDRLRRDIGVPNKYWGPASCRSAMPKTSGSRRILFGWVTRKLITGGSKIRATVSMIAGSYESVKAIANGTQNGYGDCYMAIIYNGISYPAKVVDSIDRFGTVMTPANIINNDDRWGRAPFGDILTFESDLGNVFVPDNAEIVVAIMCEQTPHNDSSQSLPGQYMVYSNRIMGKDYYGGVTALTASEKQQWMDIINSGVKPSTLPGSNLYTGFGFDVHNVYTLTDKPTCGIIGDSKNHGASNEASTVADFDLDAYGANGELNNILGQDYGTSNTAIITEQGTQLVVNASKGSFDGRSKLIRMTSHGFYALGWNDLTLTGWTNELTIVSSYQAVFDWIRNRIPQIKLWFNSTLSPAVNSSDYLTSYENQTPTRPFGPLRVLHGTIRRGAIVGSSGYVDPAAAVAPAFNENSLLVAIPANARKINTGTATINLVDATSSTPELTRLEIVGLTPFTFLDDTSNFVIPGVGAGGSTLRGQILYEANNRVRLILRNSEDNPVRIPASSLNGGATSMNIDLTQTPLFIGAEDQTGDQPTTSPFSYIHFGSRGYRNMRTFNRARGYIVL